MARQRTVFTIEGKTYYSPKGAGDNWLMKHQAVTAACIDGRIIGAFQDSKKGWCIPDNAMKPLPKEVIRKIMIIILSLKNRPNLVITDLEDYDTLKLFQYLRDIGCIRPFDESSDRIAYEAVLTNKGIEYVIGDKESKIDLANVAALFVQCLPKLLEVGVKLITKIHTG